MMVSGKIVVSLFALVHFSVGDEGITTTEEVSSVQENGSGVGVLSHNLSGVHSSIMTICIIVGSLLVVLGGAFWVIMNRRNKFLFDDSVEKDLESTAPRKPTVEPEVLEEPEVIDDCVVEVKRTRERHSTSVQLPIPHAESPITKEKGSTAKDAPEFEDEDDEWAPRTRHRSNISTASTDLPMEVVFAQINQKKENVQTTFD